MRFVPVKTAEQQSRAMVFKTRDLLVRQRNQIAGALRGHLMERGIVAPAGLTFVKSLVRQIDDPGSDLPPLVIELARLHVDQLQTCNERIAIIERRLRDEARSDPETVRLQTAPGIGPVSAVAIKAFAPPMEGFRRGRDFAAWLGLVPVQRSTGGRRILGRTSKMGEPRHPAPADHRRHDPRQVGREERGAGGVLARTHARAQAAHAGGHRAGQQDRPRDLGHDDEAGGLRGSGRAGLTPEQPARCEEDAGRQGPADRQDRGRENQALPESSALAPLIWTRPSHRHTGPRHVEWPHDEA